MAEIKFRIGNLSLEEQAIVNAGFAKHSLQSAAPPFVKERFIWLVYESQALVGALTADSLWDWLYIDELWVNESHRGQGIAKALMNQAEVYATSHNFIGLWLWTQSWQAADFYRRLDYQEFTRFEHFPRGHSRIGLRKQLLTEEGIKSVSCNDF